MNKATALEVNQFKILVDTFISQNDLRMASLCLLAGKALRISDLLAMNIETVYDLEGSVRPVIRLKEVKTGHYREIPIYKEGTEQIYQVLSKFYNVALKGLDRSSAMFTSSKRQTRMTRGGVHFLLQQFKGVALIESISSHSLRKMPGRALHKAGFDIETISEGIYGHTSVSTTRVYLGITTKEISRAWDALMV